MDYRLRWLSGLTIATGLWLWASLTFLNYADNQTIFWNSLIVGAIAIIFGGIREWSESDHGDWASWISVFAGMWLIVSPFILSFFDIAGPMWNAIVSGVILTFLSGWSTSDFDDAPHFQLPKHIH